MVRQVTRAVFAVVILGVFASGCSDSGESAGPDGSAPVEPTPTGDPGIDQAPFPVGRGAATPAGDDLVLISSIYDPNQIDAALRRKDGTWWQLPPVPLVGAIQLATAGDRAVAGGIACSDDQCTAGELAFAMLSDDHTKWTRLDVTEVPLSPSETELTTSPGPAELAQFQVGSETYSIDDSGDLVEWTPQPVTSSEPESLQYELGCAAGEDYFSMAMALVDPTGSGAATQQQVTGDVYVQPVGGSEEPVSVGQVPPEVATSSGNICAGGLMTLETGDTQWSFDMAARSWSSAPSNLSEIGAFISPIGGRLATAPDASTVFLQGPNSVIRRTGTGLWEDTGVAGHVFATDSAVLVIDQDQDVTQVWPL